NSGPTSVPTADGGGGDTSTATSSPVPSVASLDAFAQRYGDTRVTSDVVPSSLGPFAAVAYNRPGSAGGTYPHVAILSFEGASWHAVSDVTLDIGGEVAHDLPILVVSYTGGDAPDFAVRVKYASVTAGAIVSDAGGHWHALAFRGGPHPGAEIS